MRIPVVEKIRLRYAIAFSTFLFIAQQVEGTNTEFSILTAAFVFISCVAFNAAGGFVRPSGAFIFFNAMFTGIFGLVYKLFLFEPGESNLRDPISTMRIYALSMLVTWLVVLVARRLTPKTGLLTNISFGEQTRKAAIGALILGLILQAASFVPQEPGSFLAAVRQINSFNQMAILLATFYEVKKSGGRKSSNWIVWVGVVSNIIFGGFLGTSKQGFIVGPLTWFLGAVFAGHSFTRKQLLSSVAIAWVFQTYLVPYAQIVRGYRTGETLASDIAVARTYIFELGELRDQYLSSEADLETRIDSDEPHLYDQPHGFIDRLSMLPPDDDLIDYTDQGNYEGLFPTYVAFVNIIPHFIWPNKPFYYAGNEYGREVGIIDSGDETTGISFSPAADAYHQAGYWGLFLVFGILLLLFVVMDSLSGDQRLAPWGLLFTVVEAHSANEGMLVNQVYVATYVAGGVVVVALLTKYVLPVVTRVITNTERTRVQKSATFVPSGMRLSPLHETASLPSREPGSGPR